MKTKYTKTFTSLILLVLIILFIVACSSKELPKSEIQEEEQTQPIQEEVKEDYSWCKLGKEWKTEKVQLETKFYIKGDYSLGSLFLCFASDRDNTEEGYYFSENNEHIYQGKMVKDEILMPDEPPTLGLIKIK